MEIRKNMMVSLTYDLRLDGVDGEIIEQATSEKPLSFVFGAGVMLPKFEDLLEGKKQGELFEISLPCKDAYGEEDEDAIVDLPKHIFFVDGEFDDEIIKEGNTVPMMSSNGQRMNGIVVEITDDTVKMDFNHPLAGEDLFFNGNVLEVREATDEEISALFSGGCGCGCGEGSCDDGSCSTEGGGCGCGC
ncbi:MAG: peptidylprolyl isomerase [Bacteroidetes bacterium GWF2_42_66]|nr:MAG: peptidylprolyl isomerase [Bacteroidetes bacterium GWA2_42_15]OFX98860.1 MAG: peptidylprolyl isomerase [Bacteroidetes bacterium GWE2_42_39]OFY45574.1 MAG: peptidylprolyl isomerase [Bacteroidetes bacterium GWF2_42_66]HBL77448.1 peptidylprolyl isomerase [Prolixibacteraceae bacterium]HCR91217.1 peptidylprolyl isomerase [Prolixibacteraceae bacterium]